MWELLISRRNDALHWSEEFKMPVESLRRTSFFGDRRRYLYSDGAVEGSTHTGIDFSAAPGTAVAAAGAGRVAYSGNRIITGETVVIEHLPGVYTLYYHMRDRFAREGDLVEAGALIGTVGSTGLSTGAHLHWEVRVNGVPVSPDFFLAHPLIDKNGLISIIKDDTN
jgi:murein DD-endopeptidase MepM/ murein hydrolase activator NlpD